MSLENGILGYISQKPLSGYDIKRLFDMSATYFWPADQAQIYRTLKNLEENGLIKVMGIVQDAGPSKKLYNITEMGRNQLHDWLMSQNQSDYAVRKPFLMQLFFSGELSREEQLVFIDAQFEQTQALIEKLNENYIDNKDSFAEIAGLKKEDFRYGSAIWTYKWGVLSCETYLMFLKSIKVEILTDEQGTH